MTEPTVRTEPAGAMDVSIEQKRCAICRREFPAPDLTPIAIVRPVVVALIGQMRPDLHSDELICSTDLNRFRAQYVENVLTADKGELSDLEQEVVRSFQAHELLTENLNATFDDDLSVGQRVADQVARFGGSWTFILSFLSILLVWVAINTIHLLKSPFDPYPYILLNLVLSCLAAMQAPVIMMSQNRQAARDRLQAEHDYRINLKAELEIRHLNAKLDLLLSHQWQRLLEIQQVQTDLIQELSERPCRPSTN